jgi:hypothetical protein
LQVICNALHSVNTVLRALLSRARTGLDEVELPLIREKRTDEAYEYTDFRVANDTFVLMDYASGEKVEELFGDFDVESYHGFPVNAVDVVNAYLSMTCEKRSVDLMTGEQKEYYRACEDASVRELFQRLLNYTEHGSGRTLTDEVERIGIGITRSTWV